MKKSQVVLIVIIVFYLVVQFIQSSISNKDNVGYPEKIAVLENLESNTCEFYSKNDTILKQCRNFEKNIKPNVDNCKVSVIGSSSEDIIVNLKLCDKLFLPDTKKLKSQFYSILSNFTEFQKYLMFVANTGSTFEITAVPELMQLLADKIEQCAQKKDKYQSSTLKVFKTLGGNGALIANIMGMLGCQVDLYSSVPQQLQSHLHSNVILHQLSDQHDIHLAFQTLDKVKLYSKIQAKSAIKVLINADKQNVDIFSQEVLSQIKVPDQTQLVVLAGLQLLDQKGINYQETYSYIKQFIQNLQQRNIKLHLDIADMNDQEHQSQFFSLMQMIDSISINEQDLRQIVNFQKQQKLFTFSEDKQNIQSLLSNFSIFIDEFLLDKQLSRVHFHSLYGHVICNKRDK